jgi:hypothetical protein
MSNLKSREQKKNNHLAITLHEKEKKRQEESKGIMTIKVNITATLALSPECAVEKSSLNSISIIT